MVIIVRTWGLKLHIYLHLAEIFGAVCLVQAGMGKIRHLTWGSGPPVRTYTFRIEKQEKHKSATQNCAY